MSYPNRNNLGDMDIWKYNALCRYLQTLIHLRITDPAQYVAIYHKLASIDLILRHSTWDFTHD
jgi:hypothetical protein